MTPNHRLPACLNTHATGDSTHASTAKHSSSGHLLLVVLCCAVGFSGCKPFGTRAESTVDPDDWAPPNRNSYSMPHQFQSKYKHKNDTAQTAKTDTKAASGDAAKAKAADNAPAPEAKKADGNVTTTVKKEELSNKQASTNGEPVETGMSDLDLESAIANLPPNLQEVLRTQMAAAQANRNKDPKSQVAAAPTSTVLASVSSNTPAPTPEVATAKVPESPAASQIPAPAPSAIPAAVQLASNTETVPKANAPVRMSLSDSNPASTPAPTATPAVAPLSPPVQVATNVLQPPSAMPAESGAQSAIHVEPKIATPLIAAPAFAPPAEVPMPAPKQESLVSTASLPALPAKNLESGEAMQMAASSIEKKLAENPSMDERVRLNYELALRMIHLANNDLEQALKPIDHLQPEEQEYYRYQLQALYDSGNPESIPVASRRWALVMENQRKANQHLATISNLEVRNAAFCTDVQGYGVVTKFQSSMFKPDQDVLLYCELENVSAEQIRDGFETQLQGSYEIVDAHGRKIAEQLLPTEKEICSNQRRDYFVVYRVFMPMQIAAGNYEMRVTIEDMKGKKYGQSNLPFQIQIQK